MEPFGRATSHHASVTGPIYLANRNHPEEHHLQTCQDAANQNELRHSSVYTKNWVFSANFSAFVNIFKQYKDHN